MIVQAGAAAQEYHSIGRNEKGWIACPQFVLKPIQGCFNSRSSHNLPHLVADRVRGIKSPLFRGNPEGEIAARFPFHGLLKIWPKAIIMTYKTVWIVSVGRGDGGTGAVQEICRAGPNRDWYRSNTELAWAMVWGDFDNNIGLIQGEPDMAFTAASAPSNSKTRRWMMSFPWAKVSFWTSPRATLPRYWVKTHPEARTTIRAADAPYRYRARTRWLCSYSAGHDI